MPHDRDLHAAMTQPGAWTPDAANAALPDVRRLLAEGRTHQAALRELMAHLEDLRIVWGEAVLTVACPGHDEYLEYQGLCAARDEALRNVLLRFHSLGIEAKDLDQGLIDFRGTVGDHHAYLCWRDGEGRVAHWHPLEGGLGARRRLP